MEQYQEAVAEARRLVTRSDEDQWRLAQLTWEQTQAGVSLDRWAADVGLAPSTCRRYRLAYERYGQLAGERPRFSEVVEALSRGADLTSEQTVWQQRQQTEARRAIRNLPPAQKAEVARDLLQEAEVAERVVRDGTARVELAKAETKVDRERSETARQQYELQEPRSVQIGAYADLSHTLSRARGALEDAREAAETLAANGWPDESRQTAEVLGQRVHAALELYWQTVRGEQLDAELQRLLAGEGGEGA